MDASEVLKWGSQIGIPAVMGVMLVMYLVKALIPRLLSSMDKQAESFKESLVEERKDFMATLRTVEQSHQEVARGLADAIREEHQETRASLKELTRQTNQLTAAIYELYGRNKK